MAKVHIMGCLPSYDLGYIWWEVSGQCEKRRIMVRNVGKIAELKGRWPEHSIPISRELEMEELEEELAAEKKKETE
ncbi:MAG: hypothetical protein QF713_03540 [Dehalococcoidales bacterium]|jgi:hypothetical protein|nr:hypothetical protein [Dehalococcoidales bacterium]MDP7525391.1 hypothetical protein [Dehalococcoidales bacterium]|tara:strand:+ start:212 stop:439 length:228 start_codon:yes stop_codon:yes gene_type:complete